MLFFRWPARLGCFWWYQVVDVLNGLDQAGRDAALDQMIHALSRGSERWHGKLLPAYQPAGKAAAYLAAAAKLRKEVPGQGDFLRALEGLQA